MTCWSRSSPSKRAPNGSASWRATCARGRACAACGRPADWRAAVERALAAGARLACGRDDPQGIPPRPAGRCRRGELMPIRVLVVDDAMFMRSMIKDILVNAGGRYEIVGEASNGREAIARFRELNPELVTMDIVMPQLDGIEATREILKVDPAAVIVMCSAMGQEALVVESISAGAKDFIVKPFTSERVLQVLAKVLPGAGGGSAAP